MKKNYILIFILVSAISYSQKMVGNYRIDYIEGKETDKIYEKWIKIPAGMYVMNFEQNAVGLKHLKETFDYILKVNNMEDAAPTYDNSYIPDKYEDEEDYDAINTLILSGKGEAKVGYEIGTVSMRIYITKNVYRIAFINVK